MSAVVRRKPMQLLSGAIAIAAGLIVLPAALAGTLAILFRVGFDNEIALALWIACGIGLSFVLACEAFRCTFNGLCERWSNEAMPPRIQGVTWKILARHLRL